MRRLLITVAVAGLLLAVTAPAAQASQDSVTGTGRHFGADPPFPLIQVHINALANATGTDARGQVISDMTNATSEGRYVGRVTCLSAFGDPFGGRATVGIEIVEARDPALVGKGQLWSVVDGGEDRIAGFPPTTTPPVACPPLFFDVPVVSGNYVIHDAAP
jgi:hypothetical protein